MYGACVLVRDEIMLRSGDAPSRPRYPRGVSLASASMPQSTKSTRALSGSETSECVLGGSERSPQAVLLFGSTALGG